MPEITIIDEDDGSIIWQEKSENFICDFCSGAPIVVEYECAPFTISIPDALPFVNDDGFLACSACANLVDADKYDELAERSLRQYRIHHGISDRTHTGYAPTKLLAAFVDAQLTAFKSNRGIRRPFTGS